MRATLATHYNGIRQKLIGSPPVAQKKPTLFPPLQVDKNSQEAFLLRIEALEEQNRLLRNRMELLEVKTEWKPNILPHNPQKNTQDSRDLY